MNLNLSFLLHSQLSMADHVVALHVSVLLLSAAPYSHSIRTSLLLPLTVFKRLETQLFNYISDC